MKPFSRRITIESPAATRAEALGGGGNRPPKAAICGTRQWFATGVQVFGESVELLSVQGHKDKAVVLWKPTHLDRSAGSRRHSIFVVISERQQN
jgi:hypothetical protein